jgi:hypothetical protein
MKILYKLLIGVAALALLLVVLALGCVYLLECFGPRIAAERIKAMTGFRLDIASLKLSLVNGSAKIDKLHLRNPEGWPDEEFITVNSASVNVEPLTMLGGKQRVIDELVLDLGPVSMVTAANGQNNGQVFVEKITEGQPPAAAEEKKAGKSAPTFIIKHLVLKTTSIRYVDYRSGSPVTVTIPVRLSIEMRNVTDFRQVQEKLLSKLHRSFLMGMLKSVQWNSGSGS